MKPKLLLVADTYYPKVDGTLVFLEHFLKRAHSQFDISLMVPFLGQRRGGNVTYLTPSKWLKVSDYPNLKLSLKNLKSIKKRITEADIVFIQGPALISYLSIYYGHKYHKKTVFYLHTIAWELFEKFFPPLLNKLFFKLIKKMSIIFYNKCDQILVPYHNLQDYLRKEGIKTKMAVAKLGVDINLFSPSKEKRLSKKKVGINQEKTVIGYVGRISKEKNIDILLEAFQKLDDQQDLQLLMVGDGPEDQKKNCQELKNCKVTGFVDNVQDYLKAMDFFVMPSLTETTSLATLEAMSCGLPVIVTKVGFMKKYIVRNHNGLFFPRNSATMLAIKLEKLRRDRELSKKLGRNARKTVAYSFSWERSINKIKRLLLRHVF